MVNVDIISGKEVTGGKAYPVLDDKILEMLRKLKSRLGGIKGNALFVTEESYETYKKRRKEFERNLMIVGGLSAIIIFITVLLPLLSLDFIRALTGLLLSIVLSLLLFVFVLMQYIPRVGEKTVDVRGYAAPKKPEAVKKPEKPALKKPAKGGRR